MNPQERLTRAVERALDRCQNGNHPGAMVVELEREGLVIAERRMVEPMDMNPGDRVELLEMRQDEIPVGTCGTVLGTEHIGRWLMVRVVWDNGQTVMLTIPPDQVRVLDTEGDVCKP